MGLHTSYLDGIGGSYHEKPKSAVVPEKVNQTVRRTAEYKVPERFFNKSPHFNKKLEVTCLEFKGLHPLEERENFKRHLNRSGIHASEIKFDTNPVNHKNSGKGAMLIEGSNPLDKERVKRKLMSMGLEVHEKKNFNSILR